MHASAVFHLSSACLQVKDNHLIGVAPGLMWRVRVESANIWNSAIEECILTLAGYEDCMESAVLSTDGVFVLLASRAGTAMIWRVSFCHVDLH